MRPPLTPLQAEALRSARAIASGARNRLSHEEIRALVEVLDASDLEATLVRARFGRLRSVALDLLTYLVEGGPLPFRVLAPLLRLERGDVDDELLDRARLALREEPLPPGDPR